MNESHVDAVLFSAVFDIALFPKDPQKDPGVIIEIKTKGSVDKAIEQIQSKAYSAELHEHGCRIIHLYVSELTH